MSDKDQTQQSTTQTQTQVNEAIQPQVWGGEPLNTSRNALSDKGLNGGAMETKSSEE